jgi:hypothetical protein
MELWTAMHWPLIIFGHDEKGSTEQKLHKTVEEIL